MTKPTGAAKKKGGGGPQPGSGRPRKLGAAAAAAISAASLDEPADGAGAAADASFAFGGRKVAKAVKEALSGGSGPVWDDRPAPTLEELDELARRTLRHIMEKSPQDGPRVVAARHAMAVAAEARAAAGPSGKKEAQKAAAEARASSGSKFAPPPPPSAITRLQ